MSTDPDTIMDCKTGYAVAAEMLKRSAACETLQKAADAKKARARWMRERAAVHRDHAARLDAHARTLLEEAANLERMIDAGNFP